MPSETRRNSSWITSGVFALSLLAVAGCGPRSPSTQPPVQTADTLRVLTYNIHHAEGMDDVVDLERIAALIEALDPDLVALQEIDSVTTRTGGVDQAAELGRLTGLAHLFGSFMPYQGGAYGMALLSRWPIDASLNLRLPDGDEPRTALSATVTSPRTGQSLRFVGIHFYRTEEERLAQATRLEQFLESETSPTILAGDFNSMPGSNVMSFLQKSWAVADKGEDRLTFSSFEPVREIDFVLFRPQGQFAILDQWLVDEPVASDHRPVVVDFEILW